MRTLARNLCALICCSSLWAMMPAKAWAGVSAAESAAADLAAAQNALASATATLQDTFAQRADWQSAQTALQQAQADYDAVRDKALAALKNSDIDYSRAIEKRVAAQKALDDAKKHDVPDAHEVADLATDLLDAKQVVIDIEIESMKDNPVVMRAQGKLSDASDVVEKLNVQFQAICIADPTWAAAKAAYDFAQARFDALQPAPSAAARAH